MLKFFSVFIIQDITIQNERKMKHFYGVLLVILMLLFTADKKLSYKVANNNY